MPKAKIQEPKTRLAPGTPTVTTAIRLPKEVQHALRVAAVQDSLRLGRKITFTEFVIRAVIDRVGKVHGTRFANRLYRQLFNGVVPLKHDPKQFPTIELPDDYDGDREETDEDLEQDEREDS